MDIQPIKTTKKHLSPIFSSKTRGGRKLTNQLTNLPKKCPVKVEAVSLTAMFYTAVYAKTENILIALYRVSKTNTNHDIHSSFSQFGRGML